MRGVDGASGMSAKATAVAAITVGVGAVAIGAALAPSAAAVSVAGIVGGAAQSYGVGVLADGTFEGIKGGCRAVVARLKAGGTTRDLPPNHDLVRAARRAHLNGLSFVLEDLTATARKSPGEFDAVIIQKLHKIGTRWIKRELADADRPGFLADATLVSETNSTAKLIAESSADTVADTLSEIGQRAAEAALEEFRDALHEDGVTLPQAFLDWFAGGTAVGGVGWVGAAQALFAETLKTDERVRTVVFQDLLKRTEGAASAAKARSDEVLAFLRNRHGVLSDRFDRLEAGIAALTAREVVLQPDILRDTLRQALVREDFIGALDRRTGALAPDADWASSRTVQDVAFRMAELTGAFFGRADALRRLDRSLEDDRGLLMLAAPAGSGKSALLVRWVQRRQACGDLVVRHFISRALRGTNDPVDMLRHLVAQLRGIDDPDGAGQSVPYDDAQLLDILTARLSEPPPDGERLVVVLDGLDELDGRLRDVFVRANLAPGVHVVVSGRAGVDDHPPYLAQWETVGLGDVPHERFDLTPMNVDDVLLWLEEIIGHLGRVDMERIAGSLTRTTDGLPLFLRFVIEDLRLRLPDLPDSAAIPAAVGDLPAPFSDYVREQLDGLRRDMGPAWSASAEMLFALLSRTRGPIGASEIEAVFRTVRSSRLEVPDCPPLHGLDPRVLRWLSVRTSGGETFFAFPHPRLAGAFAEALGDRADDAEDDLIDWMRQSWTETPGRHGRPSRPGADYALDHLPQHLLQLGDADGLEAARLLSSPTFLGQALRNSSAAARRWTAACDLWANLPAMLTQQTPRANEWSAFLAENEPGLSTAARACAKNGQGADGALRQCAGDTRTKGSDDAIPQGFADAPHPVPTTGLVRSIATGHDAVSSVAAAGDLLATCGSGDPVVRLWQADGTAAGSIATGHYEVGGVAAFGDLLATYGDDDPVVRLWWADGTAAGSIATGHYEVGGVAAFGDLLATYGDDDPVVRLWRVDGTAAGSIATGHKKVDGIVAFGDLLASSGDDDPVVRLWRADGTAARKIATGHFLIGGVAVFGDLLATCDGFGDTVTRLWRADGTAAGTIATDHKGFWSIAAAGDLLATYNLFGDPVVRLWRPDGTVAGSIATNHNRVEGIAAVGDLLATCGDDDPVVRLWRADGTANPTTATGHDRVKGIASVCDLLATYNGLRDPVVRLWRADGTAAGTIAIGEEKVWGIGMASDLLITYYGYGDPVVRLWRADGTAAGTITTGHRQVAGVVAVGNLLATYGLGDPVVRLWRVDGTAAGTIATSHDQVGSAAAVGDLLATYGPGDPVVRLWRVDGTAAGTIATSHDPIRGITAVSDLFATCGYDDPVVRLWGADGITAGTIATGHDKVDGIAMLGDLFMTRGGNGDASIQFWTPQRSLRHILVVPGGFTAFGALGRKLLVFGRAVWVYDYDRLFE